MSIKSQSASMKKLASLLSKDLGYIFGPRESGPNGDKSAFHSQGRAFMRALGKDLCLIAPRVHVNKAGIAVSGEVCLQGMWDDHHGLYLWLEQDLRGKRCMTYRSITVHPELGEQYMHGPNHAISLEQMRCGDYLDLLDELAAMRRSPDVRKIA